MKRIIKIFKIFNSSFLSLRMKELTNLKINSKDNCIKNRRIRRNARNQQLRARCSENWKKLHNEMVGSVHGEGTTVSQKGKFFYRTQKLVSQCIAQSDRYVREVEYGASDLEK